MVAMERNTPISFMCNAREDRTGLAAMFVLTAVDVGEQTIVADYLLTNTFIDVERKVERVMALMAKKWSPMGDLTRSTHRIHVHVLCSDCV
jgi:protein tyrosine/serine phosphatase